MSQEEKEEETGQSLLHYIVLGGAILLIFAFLFLRFYLLAITTALISFLCFYHGKFLTQSVEEEKKQRKEVSRIGEFGIKLWPEPQAKSNSERDKKS